MILDGELSFTYNYLHKGEANIKHYKLNISTMSKYQALKTIRAEIEKLNQDIDLKIIKGVSYRREAMRHKFLIGQLSRIAPRKFDLLSSPLGFIYAFM